MPDVLAYILLFTGVGVFFIFSHLLMGRFVRPVRPSPEKKTIYECGEPTIGSAWIQFDLRFYVVALLFVIFDVEVAFFFPWAEVFGKAQAVASAAQPTDDAGWVEYRQKLDQLIPPNLDQNTKRQQETHLRPVPEDLPEAERTEWKHQQD